MAQPSSSPPRQLHRQLGLGSAIALNMLDMVGIGPFVTLPLVVAALGGPQAFLGWILGAAIALCDGLVWAELGAMMPQAGGSYAFLREIYGPDRGGRLASFLYVWQLCCSAPLSVASGCIGLAQYAGFLYPALGHSVAESGPLAHLQGTQLAAAGACVLAVFLLYRNVRAVARFAWILWSAMLLAFAIILFAGFTHFHAALVFTMPAGAFTLSPAFFTALGAATLLTTYDYWGYYNVCFLGGEIRDPRRNIPRAVLISIAAIAALYLAMNLSVLGAMPWQQIVKGNHLAVAAVMVQQTLGSAAAHTLALLIVAAAFASVFALLLGFSRVPYVAALDGNFFRVFGSLHPKHGFPHVALLALGTLATLFCFFSLTHVITALVTIRILLQFVLQQAGVILLRIRQPQRPRPFRVWLYPLPPLFALAGFLFILFARPNAAVEIRYGLILAVSGTLAFLVRSALRREWPFAIRSVV
ncbi:MAG TPA: APC family permease [Acidobacteriaceae bacterium]|nr:APC family permease [Acidobacteriaceae bacterium]